jgi:GNAT superfamily N-acetyltransferase
MVTIRQIRATEGSALRDIRLRALRDAPDAFAVSLADTMAQTDEERALWAGTSAEGHSRISYIATDPGLWVGIAGGMFDAAEQPIAQLISMWVDPLYRRQGIGQQLVEHVADWARLRGACRLELWVTVGNSPASALYDRCGFTVTSQCKPHPANPIHMEQKMVRELQSC